MMRMTATTSPVEDLILDLIAWLALRPRPYGEVMEAWRTSCPRLPVWEEANDRGFVARESAGGGSSIVRPTALGLEYLSRFRAL